ncbi:MAG: hypothetical protein GY906_31130, partial [bacterium]|nr:hypothetical protein [bacterium]
MRDHFLESLTKAPEVDDPVAALTEWGPLERDGSNMTTHRLVKVSSGQIRFRISAGLVASSLLFEMMGIVFVAGPQIFTALNHPLDTMETIFMRALGVAFMCFTAFFTWWMMRPIVFDRRSGFFWKGYTGK